MKLTLWTTAVLGGSAIATGACLLCAATASADTGDAATDSISSAGVHRSKESATRSHRPATSRSAERTSDGTSSDPSPSKARPSTKRPAPVKVPPASSLSPSEQVDLDETDSQADATSGRTPTTHFVPKSVESLTVDAPRVTLDVPPQPDDASVTTALEQLGQAQATLVQSTWGSGNFIAGLASIVPQLMLASAQSSLQGWQDNSPRLQAAYAATAGDPLLHDVAGFALLLNNLQPLSARQTMQGAAQLLPVVGFFGAGGGAAAAAQFVAQAAENGRVFAAVPVEMRENGTGVATEPVVYVSVNGGPRVPVLVDTGSTGLVMDPRYVGQLGDALPGGHGTSAYGDGSISYDYDTYLSELDFGDGVVTDPTRIRVVTPDTAAAFEEYNDHGAGYVGILGVGPNANEYAGDLTATVPLTALPGPLGHGFTLDERRRLLVFGLNPLPTRVALPGAPSTDVLVKIGDLPKQAAVSNVDSGGVFGTIPLFLLEGTQYADDIPEGTVISVYTADGSVLLFSYALTGAQEPAFAEGDETTWYVTGYFPFDQQPIYIDLLANDGAGATEFLYT
jgi:hypothetical protein